MQQLTSWALQMFLSGVWTDVTADVLASVPIRFSYGIRGAGPEDRVADTGTLSFALNNSSHNSAHLVGYYSPHNANCRTGFTWGVETRVKFVSAGITYYKWRGKIHEIAPMPDQHGERKTLVTCVDWMADAADFNVYDVSPQLTKRDDQVFSAVLAVMPKQPAATSIATGLDTFQYAGDDWGDHPPAPTVFQRITQSAFSYVYLKGDQTQGGTLTYEIRSTRPLAGPSNAFTLTETMIDMEAPRTLDMLLNRVETSVHPKKIDSAATTVLWSLAQSQPILVTAMSSIEVWTDFYDPNDKLSLIGGTALVTPVATTDYVANSTSDGTGTDLTANISITMTAFAATTKLVVANLGAIDAYMTTLQVRGKGIYDYTPIVSRSEDTSSQSTYGLRQIQFDMPYQNDPNNGAQAAALLKNLYGTTRQFVERVKFFANTSSSLLAAALGLEIGTKIGISETVTGISTTSNAGFYIQNVQFELRVVAGGLPMIWCSWGLIPADSGGYWVLDQVGASELDSTTILGFF